MTWWNGLKTGPKIIVGVVLAGLLLTLLLVFGLKSLHNAEKKGALETEVAGQSASIENTKDANDAKDSLDDRKPAAVHSDCVRWARNSANC